MIYLLDIKLNEHKSIFFSLTKIYGIGKKTAFLICKKLGFSLNFKTKDLEEEQITEILKIIEKSNLILNNELKKINNLNIKNLILIKSYKGLRINRGLPVRGQRTHTNAKSARKNKNILI